MAFRKKIKTGIVNNSSKGQWIKENKENQGSRPVLHSFLKRTLYHEALSGDTHQRHTHLMSQWTLYWEWTNSSLFCWLPLFDLCSWLLFGDSLLSFNIAKCRLLSALLFHQCLNWKVDSAWPSSGRKGDAKAWQSLGKWIQTVALKQYLFSFVPLFLSNQISSYTRLHTRKIKLVNAQNLATC